MVGYRIKSLRQYPAAGHDKAFEHLTRSGDATVERYQYGALANVRGIPRNATFLLRELLTDTGDLIVLGAEPYDRRVPLFAKLAERHDVVLHTSWPYWGTNDVPQPTSSDWLRRRWRSFLNDVHAVGVTNAATGSVREAGARGAKTIPHGVDTETYHPDAATGSNGSGPRTVLFVGRLEERKGVSALLDIREQWDGPEAVFRFVGDGPLADTVASAAEGGGVEYEVFVSDESRLASLYASADVLALPSYGVDGWEELFGLVVIEAMACGTPVVATNCVGPAAIIDDGETGFVVPQHDTALLRSRLKSVLADEDRRDMLGDRARTVAESRYDWRRTADEWRSVFDAVRSGDSLNESS